MSVILKRQYKVKHDDELVGVFCNYVCSRLVCFFFVRLATTVVFVPSHRDVHHDFVYPQPPFSTKVNTAEFNAVEVKLCLAYSLEYHKMSLISLPDYKPVCK